MLQVGQAGREADWKARSAGSADTTAELHLQLPKQVTNDSLPGGAILMQNLWRQGLLDPLSGQLSCQHRQRMLQVDHGVEPGAQEVWRAHDPNPSEIDSPRNDPQVIRRTSFIPDRKHSFGSSGFCRADYITRPALANERVQTNAAGHVVLKLKTPWRDGTTHQGTSPLEFMQRLAALVPRPRLHLIRFHGVLAPYAKLRAMVLRQEPEGAAQEAKPAECEAFCAHHRPVRLSWASLAGRAGPEARPLARHKQSTGLFVSGLGCSSGS